MVFLCPRAAAPLLRSIAKFRFEEGAPPPTPPSLSLPCCLACIGTRDWRSLPTVQAEIILRRLGLLLISLLLFWLP